MKGESEMEGERQQQRKDVTEKERWLQSGTKGRKSQHKPPNYSSIQTLAVYSLQEKSMNWNAPNAHRRH